MVAKGGKNEEQTFLAFEAGKALNRRCAAASVCLPVRVAVKKILKAALYSIVFSIRSVRFCKFL